jgi:hypothetical protein
MLYTAFVMNTQTKKYIWTAATGIATYLIASRNCRSKFCGRVSFPALSGSFRLHCYQLEINDAAEEKIF